MTDMFLPQHAGHHHVTLTATVCQILCDAALDVFYQELELTVGIQLYQDQSMLMSGNQFRSL